jgi:protoporphyrinogen oxidase
VIVIIGGGLAGLSTALHLGDTEHIVLEREAEAGGLCRSRRVGEFVFDYTGHLLHLRDPEVIALVDRLLPGAFDQIGRRAAIRSHGKLLPYPFQANTYGLPPEAVFECVHGFWKTLQEGGAAPGEKLERADQSFHDWTLETFGRGIAKHFMFPYNEKMWRRDLRNITADWVSWAVPKPTFEEVLKGSLGLTNTGMGYNPRFRYPKEGGIGILPAAFAEQAESVRYGCDVVDVDAPRRTVKTSGGETISYEALVCTAPLAGLVSRTTGLPDEAYRLAEELDWIDVYCLNVGIGRPHATNHHWIYFPEPEFPFYRVGAPTEFAGGVAPAETSSLYVECSVGRDERPDEDRLVDEMLDGLCRAGILKDKDEIIMRDLVRLSPAYVIFDRARRRAVPPLMKMLRELGIHAIGRFGGWTYSYMEAAIKDGISVARRLRGGGEGPASVPPPAGGRAV